MRTVRPSVSVRSAFSPSGKRLSGVIERSGVTAAGKIVFSTARRCASSSSATGSSSLSTHHTSEARPSASGSSAAGPWRVKRS